jgi:hypothetical protein
VVVVIETTGVFATDGEIDGVAALRVTDRNEGGGEAKFATEAGLTEEAEVDVVADAVEGMDGIIADAMRDRATAVIAEEEAAIWLRKGDAEIGLGGVEIAIGDGGAEIGKRGSRHSGAAPCYG